MTSEIEYKIYNRNYLLLAVHFKLIEKQTKFIFLLEANNNCNIDPHLEIKIWCHPHQVKIIDIVS